MSMYDNAKYIYNYLVSRGFTPESVCGMLGNFEAESSITPDLWEYGMPHWGSETGYGVAQWTPAQKLYNWCVAHGYDYTTIEGQCACLYADMYDNYGGGWIPTYSYPMSNREFVKSTDSPYTLAMAYLYNFERPASKDQPIRGTYAQEWYERLSGGEVEHVGTSHHVYNPTPEPNMSGNYETYVVQAGDTLSGIASRFGFTVSELADWNGISDPNKIYVGQILKLYGKDNHKYHLGNRTITYVVQPGNTLSDIAEHFGVSIDDIVKWNDISDPNKIYVGQILKIEPKSSHSSMITYKVKAGDTLSGIATNYGVTVDELANWNGISDPNKIYVGEYLKIYTGGSFRHEYIVKPGDTLSGIANKFGVSIGDIVKWNNIENPNEIYAGEVLKLYSGNYGSSYTVQPGDTLSGIANKFGVSVHHLAELNGIEDPNKIYAGQIIRI